MTHCAARIATYPARRGSRPALPVAALAHRMELAQLVGRLCLGDTSRGQCTIDCVPQSRNCDPRSRERAQDSRRRVDVTASPAAMTFCSETARAWAAGRGATGRFLDEPCRAWRAANAADPAIDAREVADVRAAFDARSAGARRRGAGVRGRPAEKELGAALKAPRSSRCGRPRSSHARPGRCSKAPWRRRCEEAAPTSTPLPLRTGSSPSSFRRPSDRSRPMRTVPAGPGWC